MEEVAAGAGWIQAMLIIRGTFRSALDEDQTPGQRQAVNRRFARGRFVFDRDQRRSESRHTCNSHRSIPGG